MAERPPRPTRDPFPIGDRIQYETENGKLGFGKIVEKDEARQILRIEPVRTTTIIEVPFSRAKSNYAHVTEKPRPKILFQEGEIVRVLEGPFMDFNGVVESVDYEKQTVKVAVLIFGRSTVTELEISQVAKG